MRAAALSALVLALLAVASACDSAPGDGAAVPSPALATVVFVNAVGEEAPLQVEIADTPQARARGLMSRTELPEDRGMLFVFQGETGAGFWMKDTHIPLDIAFLAGDGEVMEIQQMEPLSTDAHRPAQPYAFAVEANRGWFERNGVVAGSRARLPEAYAFP